MKFFMHNMVDHTFQSNQAMIGLYVQMGNDFPVKAAGLLAHIVNAHHIWNHRIQSLPVLYQTWQEHLPAETQQIDTDNHQQSLHILDHFDPESSIHWTSGKGITYEHAVADLLYQAISHAAYHRGQIAMLIREAGFAPPSTDFILFRMQG
jgi:uncharacterized damage-inducible protein DinB